MPYLVACPNCGSKLKSAQPVPAGRTLTCPQCKGAFTLSAPAPEVDVPVPPTPKPPGRSVASALDAFSAQKGRSADPEGVPAAEILDEDDRPRPKRRRTDDDDDRPRPRRRDDDEDDRPRSRRRQEEDDDRPRSRRGRGEDDDDDRPTSNRRRDDEDDDRPASRRRRNDTDDSDERPRSRRPRDDDERDRSRSRRDRNEDDERPTKRKARAVTAGEDPDEDDGVGRRRRSANKRKGKGLLIGLLAAGVLLLMGAGGAIMYFVDPFGLFGGTSGEMLAWMPSNTTMISYTDVSAVGKYEKPKAMARGEYSGLAADLGLKLEDMDAVMTGRGDGTRTTVIKLASSANRDAIISATGGQEATAAGKKYYQIRGGGAVYFVSDRMLVHTNSSSVMPGLLGKNGKVELPSDMRAAAGKARGQIWQAQTNGSPLGGGGAKGGEMFGIPAVAQPRYSVASQSLSGTTVDVRMEMEYADSGTARQAADSIEKMLSLFRGLAGAAPNDAKNRKAREFMESARVSTSGSTVVLTIRGSMDESDDFKMGFGF